MSEAEQIEPTVGDSELSALDEEVAAEDGPAPDVEADSEGEPAIPLDIVFDILKNQRRRHVLRYLREHETATLGDLAEHVAALENDKEVKSLTSSERKRVYVGLYQCHLPRMDDAGVIDFDSDRGTIELEDRAAQLDAYLDDGGEPERPWSLYYLSIAAAGGLLYATSFVLAAPAALASVVVIATLLAVVGCSIAHHREREQDPE